MPAKLLQLNLSFTVTAPEYERAVTPLADRFAETPGLVWKIWTMNEEAHEAGGVYLFEDEGALTAFLEGPLCNGVKQHPAISNISAKAFDVLEDLTAVTRGPIKAANPA